MDAATYWTDIVSKSLAIEALHVGRYMRSPSFPARFHAAGDWLAHAEEARISAARQDKPYWDALLRIAAAKGILTDDLLVRASRSHPQEMHLVPIAASEIRREALKRLVARTVKDEVIIIASKVGIVGGQTKHFPMMDLRCDADVIPLTSVERLANWLLPRGYVLFASGRSYHLVGVEPVSESDLSKFLVRALYACDLVDRKYIAHHLERGFCTLRISPSERFGSPILIQR